MGWLTDTHCHLNLKIFQDELSQTLERAWETGLGRILIPGIDLETSRQAVEMAERIPNLYAAVGVHPNEALSWNGETYAALQNLAGSSKVVAIGEIGLDYYRDHAPQPLQREVFNAQLQLAADLQLPVVVHNRASYDDVWAALMDWHTRLIADGSTLAERPGVLHSFDGSLSMAQAAVKSGFFIGISGPVTFKNAQERQTTAAGLPLDHILIETDAPYLTPHPLRGRWPNEPAYVAYIAEKIAELHALPLDTVTRATWDNAVQLFDWE